MCAVRILLTKMKCAFTCFYSFPKGSELEQKDIKRAYLNGKGCLNYMLNTVPFMNVEDEPRVIELVKGLSAYIR